MTTETRKIRLKKIEAGRYETTDGRFEIRDTYDPSGAPWVRAGRAGTQHWLVIDRKDGQSLRDFTLSRCRERIASILDFEEAHR